MNPSGVLIVAISLLVGIASLAGARDLMGSWGFRLAALPVGLAGWSVVALVTTFTGQRWSWPIVAVSLAAYAVALLASTLTLRGGRPGRSAVKGCWGDLVFFGLVLGSAVVVAEAGVSVASKDSWAAYALFGISLRETGRVAPEMFAFRGTLLPSLHAAGALLGGTWTYVIYPVMAASVAALVAYAVALTAFPRLDPSNRLLASVGVTALMVTTAPFVLHALYIHSNMASALYLLLGLVALERASSTPARGGSQCDRSPAVAWALVAGVASATFALVRPDGIAYAFVIHSVVALLVAAGRLERREAATYFAVYLAWFGVALASVLPDWGGPGVSRQTTGATGLADFSAALLLAVFVASVALAVVVLALPSLRAIVRRPLIVPTALFVGGLAAIAAAWVANPGGFARMLPILQENLTAIGGHNLLWYWALGVLLVALLLWSDGARSPWLRILAFVVFLFFAVALVVHGLTHSGRTGWSDSLNRLVFHVVPVLFWLFAMEIAIAAEGVRGSLPRLEGIGYPRGAVREE